MEATSLGRCYSIYTVNGYANRKIALGTRRRSLSLGIIMRYSKANLERFNRVSGTWKSTNY